MSQTIVVFNLADRRGRTGLADKSARALRDKNVDALREQRYQAGLRTRLVRRRARAGLGARADPPPFVSRVEGRAAGGNRVYVVDLLELVGHDGGEETPDLAVRVYKPGGEHHRARSLREIKAKCAEADKIMVAVHGNVRDAEWGFVEEDDRQSRVGGCPPG